MNGALIKIGWAFVLQEYYMPKFIYHFHSRWLLDWATFITPVINNVATMISGMPQTDLAIDAGDHLYPGSDFCNLHSAHAFWHQ